MRAPLPIGSGERFYDPERFLEALGLSAIDCLEPDVIHVGGLLEAKRARSLALLHDRPVSAHNPNGPVCNAMSLQLAASVPNFVLLETMTTDVPRRREAPLRAHDLRHYTGALTAIRPPDAIPYWHASTTQ